MAGLCISFPAQSDAVRERTQNTMMFLDHELEHLSITEHVDILRAINEVVLNTLESMAACDDSSPTIRDIE